MGKRSPESSSYQNSLPAAPRINMVHEEFETEDLFNMCISFLNPSVEILRLDFRIWPFRCTVEPKQTPMTEKKKASGERCSGQQWRCPVDGSLASAVVGKCVFLLFLG